VSSAAEEPNDPIGQFLLSLRARGYRDTRLLTAIERAPRAQFAPSEHATLAYQELALPISCGQQATAPSVVVDLVQRLAVEPSHQVLEIGTGTGWQTAIFANLCQAVVSVERFQTLADDAQARLDALGIANAVVAHGDGEGGLPAAAPFDRIVFNAAVAEVSPLMAAQLAEGGFVLAPVQAADGQFLTRHEWQDGRWVTMRIGPSMFPQLMPGTAAVL
jgi:protein-L-isoaspartate(D-aspartate) O-methyltransferase